VKIIKPGAKQVKPEDYIGDKAVCRNCKAVGEVQGSDVREIKFKGVTSRPMLKCPNCGGWMLIDG